MFYMRRVRWEDSVIIVCTNLRNRGKMGNRNTRIRYEREKGRALAILCLG